MFSSRRKAKVRQAQKEDQALDLSERLVTILAPNSAAAEAYRVLRTNLFYSIVDSPPRVVVLTSPGPREGKSTTCANLGVVLAQAQKSVLLLDCDLRKPVVHRAFGIRNMQGVVDVIAGQKSLRDVWQEPVPGLKVVPVGPLPPNPSELLGSKRFSELLDHARKEFDYVLVDAPPVEPVSDPIVLATLGDGVLLVLDAQNTRKGALRQSVQKLEAVGAKILGTVVNNVKKNADARYYGYVYE